VEHFDVVDESDRVLGTAPRDEVHARGLLHRAVHVFVFDTAGRLWVQTRSATKDEYPLRYTSSASGHVSAGDDYDATAPRELAEELGIENVPLERLVKLPAGPETANEHTVLYRTTTDAEPIPDAAEVAAVHRRELDELLAELDAHPERFSPPFRVLLRWYAAEAP
jgi:isopentenyl-diphosphate Delta-isomerase